MFCILLPLFPYFALQSVVGGFHTQDQGIPSSGGHQSMSQQPAGQGTGFGRQSQSFYSTRAVPRGGPRNARGGMNGYRGPSNGFRGLTRLLFGQFCIQYDLFFS